MVIPLALLGENLQSLEMEDLGTSISISCDFQKSALQKSELSHSTFPAVFSKEIFTNLLINEKNQNVPPFAVILGITRLTIVS